jgi:uncharacterized protein YbjT (DUF2867 family)
MTTLLIAGATGLIGSRALAIALADQRVRRVVAPTRRPIAAHPKLANPRLDTLLADPSGETWRADGAICALGTTQAKAGSAAAFRAVDHDMVLAVARNCRAAGTRRFALVSSLGADPRSRFLYTRTKGEVEAAIVALAFPSLTILRPGFLDGDRDEVRPLERVARLMLRLAGPLLPRSARASSPDRVARVLVEAALADAPGVQILASGHFA